MLVIGLTGGIACGKSTVSKILSSHFPIIDADAIVTELYQQGHKGYDAVIRLFGKNALKENGEIDRQRLASIVFEDEAKRKKLNSAVHKLVFEVILIRSIKYYLKGSQCIILDVPLLFESGLISTLITSKRITVSAPELVQVQRLKIRNNFSEEEALKRIRTQMPTSEKEKRSDYVIHNDGSLDNLHKQVDALIENIKNEITYKYPILPPLWILATFLIAVLLLTIIFNVVKLLNFSK